MTKFTKTEENYIEHEVELRLHEKKFQFIEDSMRRMEDKLDSSVKHLDGRLDSSIKHLDNKFMLMFSIIIGSIWLPAILHYLHIA